MRIRLTTPATTTWTMGRYFFLALAIASLGIYSYASMERIVYQKCERQNFDRELKRSMPIEPSSRMSLSLSRLASPNAFIGRLSVPRLHMSAMVREGIDNNTLQLAVGHIPGTALPGQAGNVAVAGHRDTFFRCLKDIRTGDAIQFSTLRGDFKYVVESLTIVEPDNVGVLAPSSVNVLTMVTCYPFFYIGAAPKRFIVRAQQVSPQAMERSTVQR
jgi:sortase A